MIIRSLILISVLVFSSCASISSLNDEQATPIISSPQSPFSLQISSVLNDGITLSIQGAVSTKESRTIDKVSIRLIGFKDGQEAASVSRPLRDFIDPTLKPSSLILEPDDNLFFALSIPSKDLSDFQVSLGWGDDAVKTVSDYVEWRQQGLVELAEQESCQDCPRYYAVEGMIYNKSDNLINSIKLTLKIYSPESPLASEGSPPDELELSPLNLAAKATQKVRLKIKQPILKEAAEKLKIDVNITSFK